jgi:cytoskeletal protein CcmA (bactofilin family)
MSIFKKNEPDVRKPLKGHEPVKSKTASFSDTRVQEIKKSLMGKTVFVKGNIFSEEEVRIEGKIEGKLSSKHMVVVGKNGIVNADIEAREIIIEGTVNGNVKGSYKVEIVPDGVLNGNIISQRVVLAEGAVFKGNIDMTLKEEKNPGKELNEKGSD